MLHYIKKRNKQDDNDGQNVCFVVVVVVVLNIDDRIYHHKLLSSNLIVANLLQNFNDNDDDDVIVSSEGCLSWKTKIKQNFFLIEIIKVDNDVISLYIWISILGHFFYYQEIPTLVFFFECIFGRKKNENKHSGFECCSAIITTVCIWMS